MRVEVLLRTLVPTALVLSATTAAAAAQGSGSCEPEWIPTFGGLPGFDGDVHCSVVFDDGSGPALYLGGAFTSVAGVAASGVVRWDGSAWSPLHTGIAGTVHDLAVFDDGAGPALYAAGASLPRVARWDGSSWTSIISQPGGTPLALAVFDDGTGPALYAGGGFTSLDGVPASNIARWDGTSWSALAGGGPSGPVWSLEVFDDGGGADLYAGGVFTTAGGTSAGGIARWNGSSWSEPGAGTDGLVYALEAFDDGSGPALYAGGEFTLAGGAPAQRVARWDGAAWSPLGSGTNERVYAFAIFDDGGGPALHAGGDFTVAGGVPASGVAKWDGASWSALSAGIEPSVATLTSFDDGSGSVLYAGGGFTQAGGQEARRVAGWDGSSWFAPGPGNLAPDSSVLAHFAFDDGAGPALFAGGRFEHVGLLAAGGIARWDGLGWTDLAGGVEAGSWVSALASFDDGSGPALHAGGLFLSIGGTPANSVARWDGASWSALGQGLSGTVESLGIFDDGSGPALYAGGSFGIAGAGVVLVARWDGSSWIGLPGPGPVGGSTRVEALAVFDDGTGAALYAGGSFSQVNGAQPGGLAKWDGASWSHVSGWNPVGQTTVLALEVFDAGSGPELQVGGSFFLGGGTQANNVARWDGSSWSALGSELEYQVNAFTVHDDGNGPALYASGGAQRVARWDGSMWTSLGSWSTGTVSALGSFDSGHGPGLYAGGSFDAPSGDRNLALWRCSPDIGTAFCAGTSMACPCTNPGGAGEGCANSTGQGASLAGLASASVLLDLLRVEAAQLPASVPCLLVVADGQAGGGAGLPFGDGLRCVVGNERRLGLRVSDLAGGASWGPGLIGEAGYVPGQTGYFQVIYRDPSASPCGTTFNLSSGLAVDFD